MNDGPLIVQSDKTLLLEVDHEQADACRKAIAPFAELERSPEHIHTYRLTPLGLWNARAAGHDAEQVVNVLLTLQPLRRAARAAGRRGRDDGALRPAAARQGPAHGLVLAQHRPRGVRGGPAQQEGRRDARRAPRRRQRRPSTPASAATSSRRCSSSAGRPRTSPATSTARPTRSSSTRATGRCAPTSRRRPTRSGTAAPGSSYSPVVRARPSSAPPPWRRPRPPR